MTGAAGANGGLQAKKRPGLTDAVNTLGRESCKMIGVPTRAARAYPIARSRQPTDEETELISAYLDGELSEEESARVETLLAERPDLAELLQQFRDVDKDLRDRFRK